MENHHRQDRPLNKDLEESPTKYLVRNVVELERSTQVRFQRENDEVEFNSNVTNLPKRQRGNYLISPTDPCSLSCSVKHHDQLATSAISYISSPHDANHRPKLDNIADEMNDVDILNHSLLSDELWPQSPVNRIRFRQDGFSDTEDEYNDEDDSSYEYSGEKNISSAAMSIGKNTRSSVNPYGRHNASRFISTHQSMNDQKHLKMNNKHSNSMRMGFTLNQNDRNFPKRSRNMLVDHSDINPNINDKRSKNQKKSSYPRSVVINSSLLSNSQLVLPQAEFQDLQSESTPLNKLLPQSDDNGDESSHLLHLCAHKQDLVYTSNQNLNTLDVGHKRKIVKEINNLNGTNNEMNSTTTKRVSSTNTPKLDNFDNSLNSSTEVNIINELNPNLQSNCCTDFSKSKPIPKSPSDKVGSQLDDKILPLINQRPIYSKPLQMGKNDVRAMRRRPLRNVNNGKISFVADFDLEIEPDARDGPYLESEHNAKLSKSKTKYYAKLRDQPNEKSNNRQPHQRASMSQPSTPLNTHNPSLRLSPKKSLSKTITSARLSNQAQHSSSQVRFICDVSQAVSIPSPGIVTLPNSPSAPYDYPSHLINIDEDDSVQEDQIEIVDDPKCMDEFSTPILSTPADDLTSDVLNDDTRYKKIYHKISTKQEIADFYQSIRPTTSQMVNCPYQYLKSPTGLSFQLYRYQLEAISWMYYREMHIGRSPLLLTEKCQEQAMFNGGGGILADEMGLGKTVEILGLILANPCNANKIKSPLPSPTLDPGRFSISSCSTPVGNEISEVFESCATLVISPKILLKQWEDEIKRHAPNLKVTVYRGIYELGSKMYNPRPPGKDVFGDVDIVLSCYEALSKEFHHTLKPCVTTRSRSCATGPKYTSLQSPLKSFRWWRICMDEAQSCSRSTSQTGKMCRLLQAHHRWAVTGTPIHKSFADIKGLLEFLGCCEEWYQPTENLVSFLKTIMWRHAKSHVENEIVIMPTKEHVLEMKMDPVEIFCYKKLLEKQLITKPKKKGTEDECDEHALPFQNSENVQIIANTYEQHLNTVNKSSSLRQGQGIKYKNKEKSLTCVKGTLDFTVNPSKFETCPFQVIAETYFQSKTSIKSNNRDYVYKLMTENVFHELYETQIQVGQIFNRTGDYYLKQALQILLADKTDETSALASSLRINSFHYLNLARENYYIAIDLGEYNTNSEIYQQLAQHEPFNGSIPPPINAFSAICHHATFNLAQIERHLSNPTQEKAYLSKVELLKVIILQPHLNTVRKAKDRFFQIKTQTSRLIRNRNNNPRQFWWSLALDWIEKNHSQFFEDLRHGVKQYYDTKFHGLRRSVLSLNVFKADELIDLLDRELRWINSARTKAIDLAKQDVSMESGQIEQSERMILETIEAMHQYEMKLVSLVQEEEFPTKRVVHSELNLAERILLYVEYICTTRHNPLMNKYQHDPIMEPSQLEHLDFLSFILLMAEEHFRELELMKLEILTGSPYVEEKQKMIIASKELDSRTELAPFSSEQEAKHMLDEAISKCLQKKKQLDFLIGQSKNTVPHTRRYGTKLYMVAEKLVEVLAGVDFSDHGTNVNERNQRVKALIFSSWSESLTQLGEILRELGIKYQFGKNCDPGLGDGLSISYRIELFQKDPNVQVLMLNILNQSSGLTLTQANHLFILDEVDLANEKQAIGRSHRIGQTKTTHIYRFKQVTNDLMTLVF